jgi:AraC family transcriptional regulator
MNPEAPELGNIEARVRVPNARAELGRFNLIEPLDRVVCDDFYRIDLCLTPRPKNTRALYPDHWGPNRFEPLGDMYLVPPQRVLRIKTDGGGQQRSVICYLDPESMHKWLQDEFRWQDDHLKGSLNICGPNIRNLLFRLAGELRSPGFGSDALVELIAAQITLELGRYCTAIKDTRSQGGLAPRRLRLIDERLNEVNQVPTLSELATLCGLSIRQLTRAFRVSRGCTIADYVAQHQLRNAKRLLLTEQSVKSIAYSLGFASPSSFSCTFRRATGQTPGEFRRHAYATAQYPTRNK